MLRIGKILTVALVRRDVRAHEFRAGREAKLKVDSTSGLPVRGWQGH